MTRARYDAVIVGAGPAGCATALALLGHGARVAIVERRAAPEDRMGESLRGVGCELLRELGVWPAFLKLEQRPSYLHRAAWAGHVEERQAIRSQFGPDLHLDRAAFDALLLDAAVARGAALFRPAALRDATSWGDGVSLSIQCGRQVQQLEARMVVDASGHGAVVARRFGAVRHYVDRLIGMAQSFDRGQRLPATLVEAADEGWWYTAPQPRGRMVALFITDGDAPARAGSSEAWRRALQSAPLTRDLLGATEAASLVRRYLATPSLLAWNPCVPVLPVGDAALCFDPISADGLCFALRSGIEAAAALRGVRGSKEAYHSGIHGIFSTHVARREQIYASERRVRPTPFWSRPRGRIAAAAQ
jgi:2-polyprenyl-6-methoxyphenol hydroxylase-like FAD-dependent oxidoreductase